MTTPPLLSPPSPLTPLPPHSRRSSHGHPPQLTHRSPSQTSSRGQSLASLLGEARKPRFETLEDLSNTPIAEAAPADGFPFEGSALQLDELPGLPSRDASVSRSGGGKVYTSLPPSPVSSLDGPSDTSPVDVLMTSRYPSAPNLHNQSRSGSRAAPNPENERARPSKEQRPEELFSIWDYLRSELLATDADHHQEMKWERVENFLMIPVAVEKTISFGFLLSLDAFLYIFTILPIRSAIAVVRWFGPPLAAIYSVLLPSFIRPKRPRTKAYWQPLPPSSKADLLRMALVICTFLIMYQWSDASRIYHSIRGQDTIKLYVIFNAVEVADRLLCALGQDLMDCLFSRSILAPSTSQKTLRRIRTTGYFFLTLLYSCAHSMTLIYYLTSLNVAINSYDNALLTLLLSNQFVEIKGSVFKKFEKDNLFQVTCADIVERFQLAIMLFAIALRNLIEMRGSEFSVLPQAFSTKAGNTMWAIVSPVVQVLVSEVGVDWLKHAFICKFNSIRVSVYERFTDVLCHDLISLRPSRKHTFVDHSPLVSRRLGLATIPLACVLMRVTWQALVILHQQVQQQRDPYLWLWWTIFGVTVWFSAVSCKVLLGLHLISFASRRRAGFKKRAKEDVVNNFDRPPIGESIEEQGYNRKTLDMLERPEDDQRVVPDMVIVPEEQNAWGAKPAEKEKKKKTYELEELNRWTMVKRIW
ncbi:DUF747-domain-containing protein [Calocera cornea HHB12733]|uniref:DUF747-domain-containing protein n=1 Tax=Calocera cornea HHB12733 TaxID=1353952 RepID=A0A165GY39_9BASI|nr:DUF747-domain-containing protein [Calocera cornea HHB12733]